MAKAKAKEAKVKEREKDAPRNGHKDVPRNGQKTPPRSADKDPRDKERPREREQKEAVKAKEPPAAVNGKPLRSPFASDELGKWRQLLMSKRAEITNDIAGLVKDAMEAEDGHTTPNHIAERGSDADLQDLSLGMVGEESTIVWQIDRALRKIDEGSPIPFGLCEYSKQPIPRTRLQLLPWTPLSIEGAQYMEENRLTLEDVLIDD